MNNDINFSEYNGTMPGCVRRTAPTCPKLAVIPAIVVENTTGIKGLSDCFVHVANINTTYYIDDKKRMIVTWAGPLDINEYDYTNNPLRLRGQTVFDFANNRGIHYDNAGNYKTFTLA